MSPRAADGMLSISTGRLALRWTDSDREEEVMKASKETLPVAFEDGNAFSRQVEWGDMNVAFEAFPAGMDSTQLFKGLPDDRCQCPHWGYLLKGRIRVRFGDREEVITAGDVYYLPPGHTGVTEEDVEVIEFSPKGEYQKTMEVAMRNYQATQS